MTSRQFQKVALIGREGVPGVRETLIALIGHLIDNGCHVVVEANTAKALPIKATAIAAEDLVNHSELLIVVGGDGSLLNAARIAVPHNIPVLGINRGRLGFLTDIHPNEIVEVDAILQGRYLHEQRFLLQAEFKHNNTEVTHDIALNDVVLLPGDVAQMIEFDVFVNQQFVCHHRADGMIIATPTGSTAYALSGGGPILYPDLNAVVLVPMFPHTLSSRPIVISCDATITLKISKNNETSPYCSCDGLNRTAIHPGDAIIIKKYPKQLQLIHPLSYNYFNTLREKLHWEKQATRTQ